MTHKILVHFLSTPETEIAPISPDGPKRPRIGILRVNPAGRTNYRKRLEARVRIELTYKGFADLSLTTWVPRLTGY